MSNKQNNTVTATELTQIIGTRKSTTENNIKWLKEHNYAKRHGFAKTSYWEVLGFGEQNHGK